MSKDDIVELIVMLSFLATIAGVTVTAIYFLAS